LNKDLSAEEYFTIVVSSTDLKTAKFSIRNVIDKLKNTNDKNHDSLQKLYEDFFQSEDIVEQTLLQTFIKILSRPTRRKRKKEIRNPKEYPHL